MKRNKVLISLASLSMVTCALMPLASCSQNLTVKRANVDNLIQVPIYVNNVGLQVAVTTDYPYVDVEIGHPAFFYLETLDKEYIVDGIKEITCRGNDIIDYCEIKYLSDQERTQVMITQEGILKIMECGFTPITVTPKYVVPKLYKATTINHSTKLETQEPILYKGKQDYKFTITKSDALSKYVLTDKIDIRVGNSILEDKDYTYVLDDTKKVGTLTIHGGVCYDKLTSDIEINPGYGGELEHNANIYLNGMLVDTLQGVLPSSEPVDSITFDAPFFIDFYGKKLNKDGELEWEPVSSPKPTCSDISVDDEKNTITISFPTGSKHFFDEDINIHVDCINKNDSLSFERDTWKDLIWWTHLFKEDSDTIAKSYGYENGDELLGKKKVVWWDNQPHKVLVVGTNQLHISPWSADDNGWRMSKDLEDMQKDSKYVQEVNSQPTAAFTFKFMNVLTDSNGNVVKSKFSNDQLDDDGWNHWVNSDLPWASQDGVVLNGVSSVLRTYIRSYDFLDKFNYDYDCKEIVKNVKTVAVSHLIWNSVDADTAQDAREAYVSDQFFIPTCEQIGAPSKEDDKGHWYFTEKYTDTFELYQQEQYDDKPDREACDWRRCGPVGWDEHSNGVWYWTSSPSKDGSGWGRLENSVDIGSDGKVWSGDMTDKNAILPCFCI